MFELGRHVSGDGCWEVQQGSCVGSLIGWAQCRDQAMWKKDEQHALRLQVCHGQDCMHCRQRDAAVDDPPTQALLGDVAF